MPTEPTGGPGHIDHIELGDQYAALLSDRRREMALFGRGSRLSFRASVDNTDCRYSDIVARSGLTVRVILISRLRTRPPEQFGTVDFGALVAITECTK